MEASYDIWSTHIPALALAVQRYGKRILELGCGWYSTPMLHALSGEVITIETDGNWARKFQGLCGGKLIVVGSIIEGVKPFIDKPWDVVFLDSESGDDRVAIARLFLDKPVCIVGHDTERDYWNPVLNSARYIRHFDFMQPRTSHFSNCLDVTKS